MLNVNRRFARDPSFLFWAFDMKEKNMIHHSAGRYTVKTGGRLLKKKDLINIAGEYNINNVTVVPQYNLL